MYHQRNLYQQNGRNAAFEFLAHRPAVPDFHSHPCPDASSKESQQQKRCFRNALLAFFALRLSMPYAMNTVKMHFVLWRTSFNEDYEKIQLRFAEKFFFVVTAQRYFFINNPYSKSQT